MGIKGIVIIYLFIGVLFCLIVELLWPYFVEEESGEMKMIHRIVAILFWPIILIFAFINAYLDNYDDDNNGPTEGWGY